MAAFKFFNIGKANEEVTRLEAELSKAQAEAKTATENAAAVSEQAEGLQAKLTQAEADLATAKASISSITTRAEKAETDLKAANERLANPSEEIKIAASRKALEITAGQGQPPASASTATAGAGDILAQFDAIKDPGERQAFFKKHSTAIFRANQARKE